MDATNFLFVDYPEDYVRTTRAERDMALCVFARLLAYFSVQQENKRYFSKNI